MLQLWVVIEPTWTCASWQSKHQQWCNIATFSYYFKTFSFTNFARLIFASQFGCRLPIKKRLVMTSFGWVFDFVSNWFKSFRIKEPPALGFLGAKTIKEPHCSWKIWQKNQQLYGQLFDEFKRFENCRYIWKLGIWFLGTVIVNLIPNRGFVAVSNTRPTLLWTTCFVC